MDILEELFPTNVAEAIKKIHLSEVDIYENDSPIWTLTPSGNFLTKSTYTQFIKRKASSSTKLDDISIKVF